jgi:adsorption protein B
MLWLLAPLAVAILISGLDDVTVDLAWAAEWVHRKLRPRASIFPPGPRQLEAAPRHRIAILLPLWHEAEVIARMLEHNIAAIRYPDYHIFAGAYPNDEETQEAIHSVERRFANVHLVLCPHDGPTSKADCLNWIYQHVCLYEELNRVRFDVMMTHDAEDLIHPDELHWINFYSTRYDFIQTPVLALPTPLREWTHGIYCDEFAEYHTRDMSARPLLGGFIPSAGVGTGYRREALQKLAEASSNRVFEPEALTEDYENGLKLFRLGCSQAFVPLIKGSSSDFVATREFFPKSFGSALRQRTRWVMGIALQGWQRHGWSGKPGEIYWLWRDRKGLIANPLSLASNVMFAYGVATGMWMRATPIASRIVTVTVCLQMLRLAVRMACSARVYGWRFAMGVPIRAVYANLLNSSATFLAVGRYGWARAHGRSLKWVKTDHAFPNRAALLAHKRKLGEILVGSGYVSAAVLKVALLEQPVGVRLGELLMQAGALNEANLYEALSLQQGLPVIELDPREIPRHIAHALPRDVAHELRVLPFKIADGAMYLVTPDATAGEVSESLREFTRLEIRIHLIHATKFEELQKALL